MATKEQILDAASVLFLEKGCKVVTMDDIASANGISKRTLYEMFENKSTLLQECIMMHYSKKSAVIEDFRENSKNILDFLIKIIDYGDESLMNLHRNFFAGVKKYYPRIYEDLVKKSYVSRYDATEAVMKKGQDEGVFLKRLSSKAMAIALMQMSNSNNEPEVYEAFGMFHFQYVRDVMLHILRGFATEKGIKTIDDYYNKDQRDKRKKR